MARVTVEDCLKNVKNRFELVLIASKRARQLMRGKEPMVPWDNDKATVVALREIAAGYVSFDHVEKEPEQEQFMGFGSHEQRTSVAMTEDKHESEEKVNLEADSIEIHETEKQIPPAAQE